MGTTTYTGTVPGDAAATVVSPHETSTDIPTDEGRR
jgi:hypothetical protein